MMAFNMDTISATVSNRLKSLVSFLCQITKGFDAIAEEVDYPNLKTALKAVAVESNQYAKEISNQVKKHNIDFSLDSTDAIWKQIVLNINEQASHNKGGEIEALCNNCETYFTKFYDDVLKDSIPIKNLTDIITFQLYATQCAFMKIRLLNKMRFNQQ